MAESQHCPSCGRDLPGEAFYANCGECKECKRKRSQQNRALQARKIAAFERFVDLLFDVADRTVEPPGRRERALSGKAVA